MEIPFLGEVIDFIASNQEKKNLKRYLEQKMPKINLEENEELKRFAFGLIDIHKMEFSGSCGHLAMFSEYAKCFMEDADHPVFYTDFADVFLTDANFLWYGFDRDYLKHNKVDSKKEKEAVDILNKFNDKEKETLRWYFKERDY